VVCGDFGEPEITEEISGSMVVRTTHVPNPPVARAATPLIVAVRRGYEEMIRLLLDAGADPNRTDKDGFSALGWATRSGNTRIVDLLQRRGAKALQFPEDGPSHFDDAG
jgi:ankyrin repeat protein